MKLKKLAAITLSLLMIGSITTGCGKKENKPANTNSKPANTEQKNDKKDSEKKTSDISGSLTASGSSALLPLCQDAADKFKESYPNISVTLNAGGSGTGLKQVADGSVDIGNSDVFAEEKLDAAVAKDLVDHKVCTITMAPIVNNDIASQVKDLTKQQLIDVFTGKIANWKELGGPDEKILLVTRPDSSGTRALFTKYALDGNQESSTASYLETDNSGELLETVKTNKGAIGYVALSYLVNNKDVAPISIDGVAPTLENTYSGEYPVWGYEHMYTKGEPSEAAKAFIDFMMSDDYAQNMEAQGYGVASKMKVDR